jgi:hypothetical protein
MTNNLNPWYVQVRGLADDLAHLTKYFTAPPLRFSAAELPGQLDFQSDSFLTCSMPNEVLAKAEEELLIVSGALALEGKSSRALKAGAVYKSNAAGGRDVFVTITGSLAVTVEIGAVVVTGTDGDGKPITREPPAPRTTALARLALADRNVAKVMRLATAVDFKTWVGLYRVHEVVESDVGGMKELSRLGWGSERDLRRFKHSANSVSVGGDASRHGKEETDPPARPMTSDEAKAYVLYVVESWLAEKMRNAP